MPTRTNQIINIHVSEAMDQFAVQLKSQDYAARTLHVYSGFLKTLEQTFLELQRERRHVPYVSAIDAVAIARFFTAYGSAATRNEAVKPLRLFMKWAVGMRYISDADAANATARPKLKVESRPKLYIPGERFPEMLEIAGDRSPLDRAFVAVSLYTLCRVSEVTGIRLGHVDLAGSEIRVYRQKMRRHTKVVISPDLHEELGLWLTWYAAKTGYRSPAEMIKANPDWRLLPRLVAAHVKGANGAFVKLDASNVADAEICPGYAPRELELVVHRILREMGYAGGQGKTRMNIGAGAHTLRRSGARALWLYLTNVIGSERALAQVSRQLDHGDLQTTQLYIGLDLEKQEIDNFLRNNRMYGDQRRPRTAPATAAEVVPLRGSQSHAEPSDSGPTQPPVTNVAAL